MSLLSPGKTFLIVESTAFFEAYKHNLLALQNMNIDKLPFGKYFVELEKKIEGIDYAEEGKTISLQSVASEHEARVPVSYNVISGIL